MRLSQGKFLRASTLLICMVTLVGIVLLSHKGLADKVSTEQLGGKDRYLTALSTDKPIYQAGEKVFVRGVLLHAFNRTPLIENEQAQAFIEIKGPKGDTVASGYAGTQDSVFGFSWEVPKDQAGGEYTLCVTYPREGHAPAERKFDIRQYRAPRLKSQIVFLRDGYGPGDKVSATLEVKRAEGGVPEGAKVTASARVDGMEVASVPAKVDAKGLCTVSFDLPKAIERGEGSLAFAIEDGGVVETAAKTLPILLQTLDIQFYPEGGDLVAGLPNRVYFEVRQPNGKPADIEAVLNSKDGHENLAVQTEHEGRGCFEFGPKADAAYSLRIIKPSGIKKEFPLPAAKVTGAVLFTPERVTHAGEPIKAAIACAGIEKVKLTLSQREVELDAVEINYPVDRSMKDGAPYAWKTLNPKDAEGVLTLTVWDEKGVPLAERLVFREPAKKLSVSITPEKKNYVPGDVVKLTVKAMQDGKPVQALVGLTVADESILEMIEKREQAPRLPAMVLLEPEVKDLADAHVYLDASNPKAHLAMDLLLGTQGWRRFALVETPKFLESNGNTARRVLALRMSTEIEEQKQQNGNRWERADVQGGGAVKPRALKAAAPPGDPKVPMPMGNAKAPAPPEFEMAPANAVEKDKALKEALNKGERQQMAKQGMLAAQKPAPRQDLVVVREFAHQVRPNRNPTDRVDFTETLYWNAGVKTDPTSGEATVSFALNDSVTSFKVYADAFSATGALGSAASALESVQPFYVEPKLPLEVSSGDVIRLPISLVNAIGSDLPGANILGESEGEMKLTALAPFDLKAMERARRIMDIKVGFNNGPLNLTFIASAGPYSDKVTRKLSVKPKGFPYETAFGGLLGPEKPAVHTLTIPAGVVPRSIGTNIAVYPTPLANMTEALQRLIQDPNGCFEQTSSTSYPLTMAQQYFLSHTGVDPKLVQTSREKLDAGYKRLVSFWCPDRGFEWFGQNPGHEALTAFGILHFTDMAQVREVDQHMVEQTRDWLLKQRDGKGGFERKRRALHTWIEDKDCSNAYILWALLESGTKPADLAAEVNAVKAAARASTNSYVLALAANSMFLGGEKDEAHALMVKLAAKQSKSGSVDGATASIVGSGGEALVVETTGLTALAWLRDEAFAGNVEMAMKFLADSCKAGRYGSTQSTVLALRAIVAYDKARAHPKASGKVRVYVDGQGVGDAAGFDQSTQGAIKLPDISELLSPGEHKLELRMEGGGEMPYALAVNYNALVPNSSKECKVGLEVKLAEEKVVEGGIVEAQVAITNLAKEAIPTPVAIIGLPGGLEPRHDQLKELVKSGKIDAYEVRGREVVLYWRGMNSEQKVELPLSLVAAVPGTYSGSASRAYLYYTDEHKQWIEGLKVVIAPKE